MARNSSRQPIRLAVRYLLFLGAIHILFYYMIANESPAWFNSMKLAQQLLNRLSAPVSGNALALILLGLTLLLAWFLWRKSSRIAALVFVAAAGWEFYWRLWQLNFAFESGFFPSWLMILGSLLAAASVIISLGALWGALRR